MGIYGMSVHILSIATSCKRPASSADCMYLAYLSCNSLRLAYYWAAWLAFVLCSDSPLATSQVSSLLSRSSVTRHSVY